MSVLLGFLDMQGYMVTKWQTMSPNQDLNQNCMVLNLLLQSCMPAVLTRLRTWSTDSLKSMWNERKDCLRMNESVGWTCSRLTIRLLNLKRPQLNRVEQLLTCHYNLQRNKKTTSRAEPSLCPKYSLEQCFPTFL